MRLARVLTTASAVVFVVSACAQAPGPTDIERGLETAGQSGVEAEVIAFGEAVNASLASEGAEFRLASIEYLTAFDEMGREVLFANVGNKQLVADFVPGDPRRVFWSGPAGNGDDITWASDLVDGDAGVGVAATQNAIASAMATWDGVSCSSLPLTQNPVGSDIGLLEFFFTGTGGSGIPAADVVQAGFGTGIDVFLPPPIIAATFTLVFIDPVNPFVLSLDPEDGTDIDGNGKFDVAFREIYYTFNFPWGIDTGFPIDVETVVLHETGHGLSQAHFGTLLQTLKNGKFHFAPRANMNAGYTGVQQELAGTDESGHCSIWGSWPNN